MKENEFLWALISIFIIFIIFIIMIIVDIFSKENPSRKTILAIVFLFLILGTSLPFLTSLIYTVTK